MKFTCQVIRIKTKFRVSVLNLSYEGTEYIQAVTMHLKVCVLTLLLWVTLNSANPVSKDIEKKIENTKADFKTEDLKIEETGEDKDRAKKAAICLQLEPGYPQQTQVALTENQLAVQNIPLTIQAQSVSQPLPTLNFVQPVAQSIPQASIVLPQQLQPIHTLQIVQPPCQSTLQTASVNIIHPSLVNNAGQSIQNIRPQPKPTQAPALETIPGTERPKPLRIEQLPQPLPSPQETIAVFPTTSAYEQEMLVPQLEYAGYIPMSQMSACNNPLHGLIAECTCQRLDPVRMGLMSLLPYPATYASPAMVLPKYMLAKQMNVQPTGRSHTHVKVKTPHHVHYHPHHRKVYQKMHVHGAEDLRGIGDIINTPFPMAAYPRTYRTINPMQQSIYQLPGTILRSKHNIQDNAINSEPYERIPSNKSAREVNTNQLQLENGKQIESQEGKIMLIDGRRNARGSSNTDEKNELQQQKNK